MAKSLKEKINEILKNQKQDNVLSEWPIEDVQGLFKSVDHNKWLKFNAINEEQLKGTLRCEKHFNTLMEKLYVPTLTPENV